METQYYKKAIQETPEILQGNQKHEQTTIRTKLHIQKARSMIHKRKKSSISKL